MLYEFIHSTRQEIKKFLRKQTINHNTCATTTPSHRLGQLFYFYYVYYYT